MNKLTKWGKPLLLTVAVGFLGACAVEPVGEYSVKRTVYETTPRYGENRIIRRTVVNQPEMRYRSLEPVGERVYIDTRGTRTRVLETTPRYRYRSDGWRTQPYRPYGPNSPVSPSQWY